MGAHRNCSPTSLSRGAEKWWVWMTRGGVVVRDGVSGGVIALVPVVAKTYGVGRRFKTLDDEGMGG